MADTNSKSGILAQAQKRFSRTKTKVLQNLGKAEKTTDDVFNDNVLKLERQQEIAHHLQKELKTYVHCLREMSQASMSLTTALSDIYEPGWTKEATVKNQLQVFHLLWNDILQSIQDSVVSPLNHYLQSFPVLKTKVAKRGRKMVDYDNSRHHLDVLLSAKKKDELKIHKAQEDMKEAKRIYDELNSELHSELPDFYNSRITFYAGLLSSLFGAKQVFHSEVGKVYLSLGDICQELSKDFEQFTYKPKQSLNKSISSHSSENGFSDDLSVRGSPSVQLTRGSVGSRGSSLGKETSQSVYTNQEVPEAKPRCYCHPKRKAPLAPPLIAPFTEVQEVSSNCESVRNTPSAMSNPWQAKTAITESSYKYFIRWRYKFRRECKSAGVPEKVTATEPLKTLTGSVEEAIRNHYKDVNSLKTMCSTCDSSAEVENIREYGQRGCLYNQVSKSREPIWGEERQGGKVVVQSASQYSYQEYPQRNHVSEKSWQQETGLLKNAADRVSFVGHNDMGIHESRVLPEGPPVFEATHMDGEASSLPSVCVLKAVDTEWTGAQQADVSKQKAKVFPDGQTGSEATHVNSDASSLASAECRDETERMQTCAAVDAVSVSSAQSLASEGPEHDMTEIHAFDFQVQKNPSSVSPLPDLQIKMKSTCSNRDGIVPDVYTSCTDLKPSSSIIAETEHEKVNVVRSHADSHSPLLAVAVEEMLTKVHADDHGTLISKLHADSHNTALAGAVEDIVDVHDAHPTKWKTPVFDLPPQDVFTAPPVADSTPSSQEVRETAFVYKPGPDDWDKNEKNHLIGITKMSPDEQVNASEASAISKILQQQSSSNLKTSDATTSETKHKPFANDHLQKDLSSTSLVSDARQLEVFADAGGTVERGTASIDWDSTKGIWVHIDGDSCKVDQEPLLADTRDDDDDDSDDDGEFYTIGSGSNFVNVEAVQKKESSNEVDTETTAMQKLLSADTTEYYKMAYVDASSADRSDDDQLSESSRESPGQYHMLESQSTSASKADTSDVTRVFSQEKATYLAQHLANTHDLVLLPPGDAALSPERTSAEMKTSVELTAGAEVISHPELSTGGEITTYPELTTVFEITTHLEQTTVTKITTNPELASSAEITTHPEITIYPELTTSAEMNTTSAEEFSSIEESSSADDSSEELMNKVIHRRERISTSLAKSSKQLGEHLLTKHSPLYSRDFQTGAKSVRGPEEDSCANVEQDAENEHVRKSLKHHGSSIGVGVPCASDSDASKNGVCDQLSENFLMHRLLSEQVVDHSSAGKVTNNHSAGNAVANLSTDKVVDDHFQCKVADSHSTDRVVVSHSPDKVAVHRSADEVVVNHLADEVVVIHLADKVAGNRSVETAALLNQGRLESGAVVCSHETCGLQKTKVKSLTSESVHKVLSEHMPEAWKHENMADDYQIVTVLTEDLSQIVEMCSREDLHDLNHKKGQFTSSNVVPRKAEQNLTVTARILKGCSDIFDEGKTSRKKFCAKWKQKSVSPLQLKTANDSVTIKREIDSSSAECLLQKKNKVSILGHRQAVSLSQNSSPLLPTSRWSLECVHFIKNADRNVSRDETEDESNLSDSEVSLDFKMDPQHDPEIAGAEKRIDRVQSEASAGSGWSFRSFMNMLLPQTVQILAAHTKSYINSCVHSKPSEKHLQEIHKIVMETLSPEEYQNLFKASNEGSSVDLLMPPDDAEPQSELASALSQILDVNEEKGVNLDVSSSDKDVFCISDHTLTTQSPPESKDYKPADSFSPSFHSPGLHSSTLGSPGLDLAPKETIPVPATLPGDCQVFFPEDQKVHDNDLAILEKHFQIVLHDIITKGSSNLRKVNEETQNPPSSSRHHRPDQNKGESGRQGKGVDSVLSEECDKERNLSLHDAMLSRLQMSVPILARSQSRPEVGQVGEDTSTEHLCSWTVSRESLRSRGSVGKQDVDEANDDSFMSYQEAIQVSEAKRQPAPDTQAWPRQKVPETSSDISQEHPSLNLTASLAQRRMLLATVPDDDENQTSCSQDESDLCSHSCLSSSSSSSPVMPHAFAGLCDNLAFSGGTFQKSQSPSCSETLTLGFEPSLCFTDSLTSPQVGHSWSEKQIQKQTKGFIPSQDQQNIRKNYPTLWNATSDFDCCADILKCKTPTHMSDILYPQFSNSEVLSKQKNYRVDNLFMNEEISVFPVFKKDQQNTYNSHPILGNIAAGDFFSGVDVVKYKTSAHASNVIYPEFTKSQPRSVRNNYPRKNLSTDNRAQIGSSELCQVGNGLSEVVGRQQTSAGRNKNHRCQKSSGDEVIVNEKVDMARDWRHLTVGAVEEFKSIKSWRQNNQMYLSDMAGVDWHTSYMSQMGLANVASEQRNKSLSCEQRNKSLASEQRNKNLAIQHRNKSLESELSNKSLASEQRNKNLASQHRNKSLEIELSNKSLASEQRNKSLASELRNKNLASEQRNKSLASEQRNKNLASEQRNKSLANEQKNKSLASEQRNKSHISQESLTYEYLAKKEMNIASEKPQKCKHITGEVEDELKCNSRERQKSHIHGSEMIELSCESETVENKAENPEDQEGSEEYTRHGFPEICSNSRHQENKKEKAQLDVGSLERKSLRWDSEIVKNFSSPPITRPPPENTSSPTHVEQEDYTPSSFLNNRQEEDSATESPSEILFLEKIDRMLEELTNSWSSGSDDNDNRSFHEPEPDVCISEPTDACVLKPTEACHSDCCSGHHKPFVIGKSPRSYLQDTYSELGFCHRNSQYHDKCMQKCEWDHKHDKQGSSGKCPAAEYHHRCAVSLDFERCPTLQDVDTYPVVEAYGRCPMSENYDSCPRTEYHGKCPANEYYEKCPAIKYHGECTTMMYYDKCPKMKYHDQCPAEDCHEKCSTLNYCDECAATKCHGKCLIAHDRCSTVKHSTQTFSGKHPSAAYHHKYYKLDYTDENQDLDSGSHDSETA